MSETIYKQLPERSKIIARNKKIQKAKEQLAIIKERKSSLGVQESKIMRELDELEVQNSLDRVFGEINITDHSVLRYIERIEGVDFSNYKDLIVPQKERNKLFWAKDGDYDMGTHIIRVRQGTVVTVLPKENKKQKGNKLMDFFEKLCK